MLRHLVAGLLFILGLTGQAVAHETRAALVIGNSDYRTLQPLRNPVGDATEMAHVLSDLGFTTWLALNQSGAQMRQTITAFRSLSSQSDLVVVFFAGHGVQSRGRSLLLPTDTDANALAPSLSVEALIGAISTRVQQIVVLVDACRDIPGTADLAASPLSSSPERANAAGIYIAHAAQPGGLALDGTGLLSPFTQALSQALALPGSSIDQTMTRARMSVIQATGGHQIPWARSSLISQIILNDRRAPAALIVLADVALVGQGGQPVSGHPPPAKYLCAIAPAADGMTCRSA